MMMAGIAIAVFLLAAVVTIVGWREIPRDGRFPISWGVPPPVEGAIGNRAGLIAFMVIHSASLALTLLAASLEHPIGWIGVGLMVFFVLIEYQLVRRLSGRGYRRAV